MKVYKTACKNCLLTPDRLVSPKRAKELLKEIEKDNSYFICHASSMQDEEVVGEENMQVCCKTFFDTMESISQRVQVCKRLGWVEEVEQPETDHGFISWKEQQELE